MERPALQGAQPDPLSGQRPLHWPSVWQLGLGLLATLGLWALAFTFALLGLLEVFRPANPRQITEPFLMAAGMALFGILLLPSNAYALSRLTGWSFSLPTWLKLESLRKGIWVLPVLLLAGHWVVTRTQIAWILLPPFHLLALGIPILWLLWHGLRDLPLGSAQRAWGLFGSGLVLGPALILIAEILAAAAMLLLGALFLASQPDLLQEIRALLESLRNAGQNADEVLRLLEPYLSQPAVAIAILAFASGIVPLIEELLKPIGVWFILGARLTPAEGFAAGLISGAGYALFENVALSSQVEGWALAVSARAGTSLLHMITTGLMGWALAQAWQRRRPGRLVLGYLIAVTIHGLWNGLALLTLSSVLGTAQTAYLTTLRALGQVAPLGLGVMTLAALIFLWVSNRSLQVSPEEADLPGARL